MLGLIQGVTEWFPISSSGHLQLFEHFFNFSPPLLFDVLLHVGSFFVIFTSFRHDIHLTLSAFRKLDFSSEAGNTGRLVVLGVVPTLLIGFLFAQTIGSRQNFFFLGIAFLVSAIFVFASRFAQNGSGHLTCRDAVIIGVFQGIAVIPGLSRSGLTISIALLLGINPKKAFQFSFLISLPAILGAFFFTLTSDLTELLGTVSLFNLILGVIVSMLLGFLVLRILRTIVITHRFYLFGCYCLMMGALTLLIS